MVDFSIIVAMAARDRGIGRGGQLPWNIPEDMAFFRDTTRTPAATAATAPNVVVMGRKTMESLGNRGLPARFSICVSGTKDPRAPPPAANMAIVPTFAAALQLCEHMSCGNVFVIGGGQLYREALNHAQCREVICNEIAGDYDCDVFFPEIDPEQFVASENTVISERVVSRRYMRR